MKTPQKDKLKLKGYCDTKKLNTMEREDFKKRCKDIFEDWPQFEQELDKLLDSGAVDFEHAEESYKECYPVVAAILERCVRRCIYGSAYEERRREAKRQMNKYLCFI